MFEEITYTENILNGKNYVLSIAIDKYQNKEVEKDLKNTVFDSENILTALEKYKIETPQRRYNNDATYDNVLRTIDDLKNQITEEDNLIVIWGGHGKERDNDGYLIFNDSTTSESTWLSYRDLIRKLEKVNAKHLILLINSCYSGKILEESRGGYFSTDTVVEDMKFASRWCLVSGRNEVSDGREGEGSPFANAIKDFLINNEEEAVPVRNITDYVKSYIEKHNNSQRPFDGVFDNQRHQNGIFYFQLKEDWNEVWEQLREKPSIEGYSMFLTKFPNNPKQIDAEEALKRLLEYQKQLITYLEKASKNLERIVDTNNINNNFYSLLKEHHETYIDILDELTIKDRVQNKWEEIKNKKELSIWTEFIVKYETNTSAHLVKQYLGRAKKQYDKLKKEKEALEYWKEIKQSAKNQNPSRILALYRSFVYQYPHSEYAQLARNEIFILEFYDRAEKKYDTENNIDLLADFLQKYPNHKFSERAKRRINKFYQEQSKEEDLLRLKELKLKKSIGKLKDFTEEENLNKEVREKAIDFLSQLKQEINQRLEEAKNTGNLSLLHKIFTTYHDYEKVEEAKEEFEERLRKIYMKAVNDVYVEKTTEALDFYISEYSSYEKYEAAKIPKAKQQLLSFQIEINEFNDLKVQETRSEDDFIEYLSKYTNAIFKEEAKQEIEKLKRNIEEEILRKRCFEEQKLEYLREYVVKFKRYEHFEEIQELYQEKKAENDAKSLIKKITQLFKEDNRLEALASIEIFQADFPKHEDSQSILRIQEKIHLHNREDKDFEEIKNIENIEKRKDLCVSFIGKKEYIRKRKEVDDILKNLYLESSISYSKPVIANASTISKEENMIKESIFSIKDWVIILLLTTLIIITLFKN